MTAGVTCASAATQTNGVVAVAASYNRDVLVHVPRLPAAGETVAGGRISSAHGGKGSNQAVQAARCGAQVRLLAALGDDALGDAALALWRDEGIDTEAVHRIAGMSSGAALVLIEAGGENRIVIDGGANASLSAAHARAFGLDGAALVAATLEVPAAVILSLFARARAADVLTLLNSAPMDVDTTVALAPVVDALVVNEHEAQALLGAVGPDEAASLLLHRRLAARVAVVSAGARGAWLAQAGEPVLHVPAHPADVIDTTGAGDALVGALAASVAGGQSWERALQQAVVVAALACASKGAEPALPRRALIDQALGIATGRHAPAGHRSRAVGASHAAVTPTPQSISRS